jgi:hypothetical protein
MLLGQQLETAELVIGDDCDLLSRHGPARASPMPSNIVIRQIHGADMLSEHHAILGLILIDPPSSSTITSILNILHLLIFLLQSLLHIKI